MNDGGDRMKKIICACLIVIALSVAAYVLLLWQSSGYEAVAAYANVAYVVEINGDTVTLEDGDGMQWAIDGAEDFELGELYALLMHDNGTPDDLTDDVILSATYSGFALD